MADSAVAVDWEVIIFANRCVYNKLYEKWFFDPEGVTGKGA